MADSFFEAFWAILLDTGVWLLLGLLLAGVVHVLVPRSVLERHLAGRGPWPIAKASLLGIPLPLCSCSVIPVAAGLRAGGAGRGASAAFAISTPQTGEESIPLTWALFGPVFAFTRPIVAVVTALTAGLLIDVMGERRRSPAPASVTSCCGHPDPPAPTSGSCCSGAPGPPAKACCGATEGARHSRLAEVFRYGFGTMLLDLAPWLAIGLIAAAGVAAAVPAGWIEANVGTGIAPMLAMLVVGVPLYVCATSSTPLAATLVAAGLSPGAALVLLLAGPATNVATMTWVIKDLGVRSLAIYLGVIAVFALGSGLLFDAALAGFVDVSQISDAAHAHGAATYETAAGVLLAGLLAWALAVRGWRWSRRLLASGHGDNPTAEPAADRG